MTSNHVRLIDACYPASAVLSSAGSDFRPNAQELSRLTYYASNRPGKLTKLGAVLEKRTKLDARKAATGHVKAKATLLVTLGIYKALATECKNELSLLTPSLLTAIDVTLTAMPKDLEVAAKAATSFTAWATYTDGNLVGPERNLTKLYLECLKHFARLSTYTLSSNDVELQSRTRLVGLAALTAVVNSHVLLHPSASFASQSGILIPALLKILHSVGIDSLQDESAAIKSHPSPSSPYLAQFQLRPNAERRAASIHVHVDGEKGPAAGDVANASIRVLQIFFSRCTASQVRQLLNAYFAFLDRESLWDSVDLCCWFAEHISEWSQYQYRFAVATQLVERLLDAQDTQQPTPTHTSLIAMITAVFTSPAPLINLSTSDIISNLIAITLRRVALNSFDTLLPALVECIASLGAHVYYADQIQDLAAELISRLVAVQINGLLGRGRFGNETGRNEGMRCLLVALVGLMRSGNKQPRSPGPQDGKTRGVSILHELGVSQIVDEPRETSVTSARRTRVRPDTWQDTLALLCESEYGVRAEYARALVVFIKEELLREALPGESVGELGLARKSRAEHAARRMPTLLGDVTARFLHALHASAYTLAVSSSLGLSSSTPPRSQSRSSSTHAATTENGPVASEPDHGNGNGTAGDAVSQDKSLDGTSEKDRSVTRRTPLHRPRQLSLALSLLEPAPEQLSQSGPTPVGPSDYSHLLQVLTAAHEQLRTRSLLAGVPMLMALDAATQGEFTDGVAGMMRRRAVRELVGHVWVAIGRIWECRELETSAHAALASLPPPSSIPPLPPRFDDNTILCPAEKPIDFDMQAFKDTLDFTRPFIDPDFVLTSLASNQNVQTATGLDRQGLLVRLSTKWTMETALRDSVEKSSQFEVPRPAHGMPVVRLMHIENMSMQSLAKSARGVGVGDLREALEGRSSMSNPNLVASLHSHDGHGPLSKRANLSVAHEAFFAAAGAGTGGESAFRPRTKSMMGKGTTFKPGAGGQDVRDVLNRIVSKTGSGSMLKQPFPALQKRQPG